MPPALSEGMSDEESGDIPYRDAPETNGTDDQDAEQQEDEDEDDEQEEGVYVVEKIVEHAWLDDGTLKLLVKWKGYEDDSDRTWEEEEGLMDGARDIVTAYYKKIGGRPQKPEEKPTPGKPGRKRKSIGTPKAAAAKQSPKATGAKRQRRQTTEDKQQKQETQERSPVEEDVVEWLPKSKNWDKDVKEVQTITKGDENNGLMACIEFNNGHTTKLSLQASYQKCPMKMLAFYEQHLVFKEPE